MMRDHRAAEALHVVGKPNGETRRGFLSRALASVTAAAAAGATLGMSRRKAHAQSSSLLSLFPNANHMYFNEIKLDEDAHVAFFNSVLGASARPMPTFQNLTATSVQQFASMSMTFENLGVMAYLGALPLIFNPAFAGGAGTIATVEARHASYLNTLFEQALVPFGVPFDDPATLQQVLTAVTPFIASLNGGPQVGFSTTPSPQNDIEIANTALALEYLERTFYDTNVPVFFS